MRLLPFRFATGASAAIVRSSFVETTSREIAGFDVVDSKKDDLVQLADLVVGSIYRSLQTDKTDRLDYLNIIRKRIDDIWYFE
jgi:hypothetical protein